MARAQSHHDTGDVSQTRPPGRLWARDGGRYGDPLEHRRCSSDQHWRSWARDRGRYGAPWNTNGVPATNTERRERTARPPRHRYRAIGPITGAGGHRHGTRARAPRARAHREPAPPGAAGNHPHPITTAGGRARSLVGTCRALRHRGNRSRHGHVSAGATATLGTPQVFQRLTGRVMGTCQRALRRRLEHRRCSGDNTVADYNGWECPTVRTPFVSLKNPPSKGSKPSGNSPGKKRASTGSRPPRRAIRCSRSTRRRPRSVGRCTSDTSSPTRTPT